MSRILVVIASVALGSALEAASGAAEVAPRTGQHRLTSTLAEVVGEESAQAVEAVLPGDEPVTWEIYVPEGYSPARPAGLLAYISPSPSGDVPRGWKPVLDRHNLIWISAIDSGNRVAPARRALLALVAPTLAAQHWAIDRERVYVAGFSGGGKMAGMVAADYPHVFRGAIYSCGINPLSDRPPGRPELFERNRFVFITGSRDQALDQTKRVYREYLDAGVEASQLMVIRGMGHRNPDGWDFGKAVDFLDSAREP